MCSVCRWDYIRLLLLLRISYFSLHEKVCILTDHRDVICTVYTIPPEDGNDTDCDTDMSDEERDQNLNHLELKMLANTCELLKHGSSSGRDDDIALCTI